MKEELKYTNFYCVCENFCDSNLLRVRFRNRNELPYGSGKVRG